MNPPKILPAFLEAAQEFDRGVCEAVARAAEKLRRAGVRSNYTGETILPERRRPKR